MPESNRSSNCPRGSPSVRPFVCSAGVHFFAQTLYDGGASVLTFGFALYATNACIHVAAVAA